MSVLIHKESKLYRTSLLAKSDQLGYFQTVFENERRRLFEMTRIVKATDHYLCFRNATAFSFNVINICVLLYVILYFSRDQANFSSYIFGLLTCINDISIVCISGILVTSGVSIIFRDLKTNIVLSSAFKASFICKLQQGLIK